MQEVLEIIKKLFLLMSLGYFAWQDYRKQVVEVRVVGIVGVVGIFFQLIIQPECLTVWKVIISMMIGLLLIIISYFTKERIGLGDGLLFLSSGCYLEFADNMCLFGTTVFLVGGFAGVCLLLKRLGRESRIAMAPFMLVAYVTSLW